MNAAVAEVMNMVMEDRITRLESDVAEVKGDVKTLGKQLGEFQTEVAKQFGAVRIEMESLRTSIERNKVWMLCTGVSTVLGIAAVVGFKFH